MIIPFLILYSILKFYQLKSFGCYTFIASTFNIFACLFLQIIGFGIPSKNLYFARTWFYLQLDMYILLINNPNGDTK